MKQIMLNIPRKNKSFIIVFISLFFYTACNTKTSEEIVPIIKDEINHNENNFNKLNTLIIKSNYQTPFFIRRNRSEAMTYIVDSIENSYSIPDSSLSKKIYKFLGTKYLGVGVYKNIIIYFYYLRNSNFDNYHLIYFKKAPVNKFENYQFYETNNIPKETSGWIYHIKGNWYLLSPFPDKE